MQACWDHVIRANQGLNLSRTILSLHREPLPIRNCSGGCCRQRALLSLKNHHEHSRQISSPKSRKTKRRYQSDVLGQQVGLGNQQDAKDDCREKKRHRDGEPPGGLGCSHHHPRQDRADDGAQETKNEGQKNDKKHGPSPQGGIFGRHSERRRTHDSDSSFSVVAESLSLDFRNRSQCFY